MSLFLIHQENTYTVLLADSLGVKSHMLGGSAYPVTAPKLVHVAADVYASHAGTLQPAVDMLSELGKLLERAREWDAILEPLQSIGQKIHAAYKERFKAESLDVRIALVITGQLRHRDDISQGRSSSLIIWEAARNFLPQRVTGKIHFAGSSQMTELATSFTELPLVAGMLRQGPLAAAHALVATHAALSKLSSSISPDANVVVVGDDDEHTVLHGTLLELSQAALIKG
jgi:hypothetical protein